MTPQVLTPPLARPVTAAEVAAYGDSFTLTGEGDQTALIESLIDAVTDLAEATVLWRAIAPQQRRVFFDHLDTVVNIEPYRLANAKNEAAAPTVDVWDEDGTSEPVDTGSYYLLPWTGEIVLRRDSRWPVTKRNVKPFSITYWAGWDNAPASVKQMLIRAVIAQSTERGTFGVPGATVRIPPSIAAIGSQYSIRRAVIG